MKNHFKLNNFTLNLASILIILCLIVFILWIMQDVIIPLLFSIILAVIVFPLVEKLEKFKINRIIAIILALIIASTIIFLVSFIVIVQGIEISEDASNIIAKIKQLSNDILNWTSKILHVSQAELVEVALKESKNTITSLGKYAMQTFQSFGEIVSISVLIPIFSFFFIYYRNAFKIFLIKAFDNTSEEKVDAILTKMYNTLQNYMIGQLTVMFIIAILNTIGLYILGIQYAWFFGILASLLMILPYIGITIGSIFPAIFALATMDSPYFALGVIAWFLFIQFIEGNFITPNIIGGKVSLNPLASMLAIILGGMLFGFAGFILALPLAALLKVLFDANPKTETYGFILGDLDIDEETANEELPIIENELENK